MTILRPHFPSHAPPRNEGNLWGLGPVEQPDASEAMNFPISDEARTLQRLTTEVTVAQIRWWSGWARAWEDFWRAYWRRPW